MNGFGGFNAVFEFLSLWTRFRNLRVPFSLFLDFDESDVVDLKSVVVVLFIGSLMCPIAVAAGRWWCRFGISELSAWSG